MLPFHFNTRSELTDSSDAVRHSFKSVFVAGVDVDTASNINAKPEEGLHVLLAAGIFDLNAHFQTNNPNTVILGLGTGTLISVANVRSVRVAGVSLARGDLVGVENLYVCRRCAESCNVARTLIIETIRLSFVSTWKADFELITELCLDRERSLLPVVLGSTCLSLRYSVI